MKHWVVTTREGTVYITRCSCGWSQFTTNWELARNATNNHKENR